MSDLKVNLNQIFSPITLQRGREYFKKNKVNLVELDDDGDVLFGEVRGSGRKTYEVDVYLNYFSSAEPIEGRCSCPVEDNCKHAVALLLAGEKRFGARKLNALMEDEEDDAPDFSDDDDLDDYEAGIENLKKLLTKQFGNKLPSEIEEMVNQVLDVPIQKVSQPKEPQPKEPQPKEPQPKEPQPKVSLPTPQEKLAAQARELEAQRNRWLGQLKSTAKQHESRQQAQAKESNTTNIVLYVLEENSYHGGMIVQVCLSRYLKNGGYGKSTPYGGVYNCLHNGNWPASMAENDRRILRLAYINKRIDVYQGKITLNGEDGHELLEKVMATGRCVVDQELKLPLVQQSAIQGEIRWQLDEQGLQRPQLAESASGHPLLLIPSEPPFYLKRHHNEFYCGDLTGLPDIELLSVLLKAPPMDEAGIEETTEALITIFPAKSDGKKGKGSSKTKASSKSTISLPEKVAILTVMPKPLLRLDSIPMGNKKSDERLARAKVSFDYDGQLIPFGSHQQTLKPVESDQGHQVIPRQMSAEHVALEQLPDAIEPVHLHHMERVKEIADLDV
nr:SWIM zinc finger family protein [Endozoicomonas sp.]